MKITESVILSETKNLMLSMRYKTLHSVQGDTSMTFARASIFYIFLQKDTVYWTPEMMDNTSASRIKITPTS
jgi:hypothetical protein